MNKVIIIGNLGKDPEARYTPSGQMVVAFPVAVNRQYTKSDGESVKKTDWFRVSAWGKTGEICSEYLRKGSKVAVDGRIDPPYAFVGDDGKASASNQITAEKVEFLSTRAERQEDTGDFLPPEDDPEIPF